MISSGWAFNWRDVIDILLVAVVVYSILRLIQGTRAVQMLFGLAVVVAVYELARSFGLLTVEWIFSQFFSVFIVILVVLFQHEIRRALVRMAVNPLAATAEHGDQTVEALIDAAFAISRKGWGGLLVIERETGLRHLWESGIEISAPLHPDILQTFFCPQAPMHDGAVIIRQHTVVAARVLLPLAQANAVPGGFGTRHRAAVGLSEECDALVIIISEERGDIRMSEGGQLSEALTAIALKEKLTIGLRPAAKREAK
ncbi:MAG: diadenylate cyclase CdaA [Mariprofundaceae bacterium]